jgi:uncharacterized membrane protein
MSNTKKKNAPLSPVVRYFLQGLFFLLPLTLTIVTVVWLVDFFIKQLGPSTFIGGHLKDLGFRITANSTLAYGVGWFVIVMFIILLGFLVDTGARKFLKRTIDSIMQRIPLINKVYKVSVQLVAMINEGEKKEFSGMSVVYCTFGKENGATFLGLRPNSETFTVGNADHYVVMIPTAPVPMGGGLMLVPVDSVEPADMNIEDFMQIYVSMGAAADDLLPTGIKRS